MAFNENTRVKIPAILHLFRLGYEYKSIKQEKWDLDTNIFTDIFTESILRINPEIDADDVKRVYDKISLALDNEDLGQEFYRMLTMQSGIKLIDFQNFSNNTFTVVTELPCKNGDEEFRPDVTLLVNGMPLAFVEVKKPNNREGILAERDRINQRFGNSKFRKFINISQVLVFSNNMEYDSESIVPIQGAFYATTAHHKTHFNCFREEEKLDIAKILKPEDDVVENFVLKDNNLSSIKHSPEFITNKDINTPTNRILTSIFSKDRLGKILKYGIAYVNVEGGVEKHIMRYPQFFATKAIERKIEEGTQKGIIWHTQGSGKTALAFYNVHYLTDYFTKKGIVPKFYFIVDRIDLMTQAKSEFVNRGLGVHTVNSREELLQDFHLQQAVHGLSGKREITVVNIQKFKDDADVLHVDDYDINTQRIYFLDEAHRSYDPSGSFLANLISSDRNAILIALTGTPLILKNKKTTDVFGNYIHKYYYNASIADGYTLKLIREGIETRYRMQLAQALREVEILKGDVDKRVIYAHEKFVEPMLDYIVDDFESSRERFGDKTIGGMVVCDSSDQAKKLFDIFTEKYVQAGESNKKPLTAALILHDVGTKDDRKSKVKAFKKGKIDFLFVYNMLLTGFDAARLKKLYIGRMIKRHNLLQTLTRVNRPYKDFRYGFVVDFADIRAEFDATNKAYFDELQAEYGDLLGTEMEIYSNIFKTKEEIESEIEDIKEQLFHFDLTNAEIFSQQITAIEDRAKVLQIKKSLEGAKNLYNIIRLIGHFDLLEKIDFKKLQVLYNETARHLDLLNLKDSLQNDVETTNLLNVALEDVLFMFKKVSEDELVIADELKNTLRKTRDALASNFDKDDPVYTSLYDELKRLFEKKNLDEISQEEMKQNIDALQSIYDKITELNRKNDLLKAKYEHDSKYARVHKRIMERKNIADRESVLHETLMTIKKQADDKVLDNERLLENEGFFGQMMGQIVITNFEQSHIKLEPDSARFVNGHVIKEYVNEFHGIHV